MEHFSPAKLIQIHPKDNVGVLARSIERGEKFHFKSSNTEASEAFSMGHKFALKDIHQGEKIIKYGVPIGTATEEIVCGDHVHLHNLKSDYLPTYTLDDERNYSG